MGTKRKAETDLGSEWAHLQATYRDIVERNTFEKCTLGVVKSLNKIMEGSVDGLEAALDAASMVGKHVVIKNPAGDCRWLVAELRNMIKWSSVNSVDLDLKDAEGNGVAISRSIRCETDFVRWLSSSAAKLKEAHLLAITVRGSTRSFVLDRNDITAVQARAEMECIIEYLGPPIISHENQIKKFLKETHGPVDPWYQHELTNANYGSKNFESARNEQRALVISGESGSGKTQYALRLIHYAQMEYKSFDAALYLSLKDYKDAEWWWEEETPSHSTAMKELYDYLDHHLKPFLRTNAMNDSCVYDMSSKLKERRNYFAIRMFENILQHHKTPKVQPKMRDWMNNIYLHKLESLLVIVDDVNPAFVRSLVGSVRCIQQEMFSNQAKAVGLVLCGTGIEDVARSYMWRDSVVTMIGQPDLSYFDRRPIMPDDAKPSDCDNWNNDVRAGILHCLKQKGTRAQIMGTNMRLLRVGVLPMLSSRLAYESYLENYNTEGDTRNLGQHLEGCQHRRLMLYGIGKYMMPSAMNNKTTEEKSALLNHAFMYGLRTSLQSIMPKCDDDFWGIKRMQQPDAYQSFIGGLIEQLPEVDDRTGIDDGTILRLGLVTSDPAKTSPALKYIACEGHLRDVLPGEGKDFEELVTVHLERYYACKNRKVVIYRPKVQVPEHKKDVEDEAVKNVYKELSGMDADLVVIVQPKESNAESPDIIVLDRHPSQTAQLDLYHVKHVTNTFGFEIDEVQRRLLSGPTCIRNAAALESGLCAKIRSRYLQLSSPFTSLTDKYGATQGQLKQEYNVTGVHIMPREALQPSWDAFGVDDTIWKDKTPRSEGVIGKSRE